MSTSDRIGIDYLTMTGVEPVQFIKTAAAAGARNVAIWPQMTDMNPFNLPYFSLVSDAALRRATADCLADHGVSIQLIDALIIQPDIPVGDLRPVIEACVEVGASRFNTISFDKSYERTIDGVAALAELIEEYGCTLVIEACPLLPISTLSQAISILDKVSTPSLKLLIDTMHLTRTNEVSLLTGIDPSLIDYVQICDGPSVMTDMELYQKEALYERAIPGEGEMPLTQILRAVPSHVIVSGEVPMEKRRSSGMPDLQRCSLVVAAIRRLLELVDNERHAASAPSIPS